MQTTGFDALAGAFQKAAAAMGEEAVREDLVEAAKPVLERVRANIPRLTGLTAEDISMDTPQTSEGGIRLEIGAHRGRTRATAGGRAWILNFLEFGTVRQPARAPLRSTWDAEVGPFVARLTARWRARLQPILGGRS